jgi:hypothetical protein
MAVRTVMNRLGQCLERRWQRRFDGRSRRKILCDIRGHEQFQRQFDTLPMSYQFLIDGQQGMATHDHLDRPICAQHPPEDERGRGPANPLDTQRAESHLTAHERC